MSPRSPEQEVLRLLFRCLQHAWAETIAEQLQLAAAFFDLGHQCAQKSLIESELAGADVCNRLGKGEVA